MKRVLLAALLMTLAVTAVAAPVATARQPLPDVCDFWPGAPTICSGGGYPGCPPPPMYCMPP